MSKAAKRFEFLQNVCCIFTAGANFASKFYKNVFYETMNDAS